MNPALIALGMTGIEMFKKVLDLWVGDGSKGTLLKDMKSDSLIDYTQTGRVEPIVLIDADCLYLDSLPEVQQSLLSIFAGYYLQAVAISTTVGKISVAKHLDKLNPRRNPGDAAGQRIGWLLAQEAYKDCLPTYEKVIALEADGAGPHNTTWTDDEARANYYFDSGTKTTANDLNREKFEFDKDKYYSDSRMSEQELKNHVEEVAKKFKLDQDKFDTDTAFRNAQTALQERGIKLQEQQYKDKLKSSEMGFGRDTISTLKELSNLSVGKLFTVEITDGLHKASMPIAIRLMASSLPSNSLVHILSINSQDNSFKERYHGWKSGRLAFIKDLIFCQDLIDAHRKNLMSDKDGIYTNLVKRSNGNALSTILSGSPSVATASNLVVMSDATEAQLELRINGKLSDFKTREKVFKETYIMIMVVIDKQWERATFYHRGIPHATEVSMRDMKASNKGNGPDVSDILAAYRMGNSPSL